MEPTSANVFKMAEQWGITEEAADALMYEHGIVAALAILQKRLDERKAREAAEVVTVSRATIAVAEKPKGEDPRTAPVRTAPRRARRYKGKLNPDIFPTFFPVPLAPGLKEPDVERAKRQIIALVSEMPAQALRVYLNGCIEADKDAVFDMSATRARQARGLPAARSDHGDPYLSLLVSAGLFERLTSGYRTRDGAAFASSYRLVHYHPAMYTNAMNAFHSFRLARTEDPSTPVRESAPDPRTHV